MFFDGALINVGGGDDVAERSPINVIHTSIARVNRRRSVRGADVTDETSIRDKPMISNELRPASQAGVVSGSEEAPRSAKCASPIKNIPPLPQASHSVRGGSCGSIPHNENPNNFNVIRPDWR